MYASIEGMQTCLTSMEKLGVRGGSAKVETKGIFGCLRRICLSRPANTKSEMLIDCGATLILTKTPGSSSGLLTHIVLCSLSSAVIASKLSKY